MGAAGRHPYFISPLVWHASLAEGLVAARESSRAVLLVVGRLVLRRLPRPGRKDDGEGGDPRISRRSLRLRGRRRRLARKRPSPRWWRGCRSTIGHRLCLYLSAEVGPDAFNLRRTSTRRVPVRFARGAAPGVVRRRTGPAGAPGVQVFRRAVSPSEPRSGLRTVRSVLRLRAGAAVWASDVSCLASVSQLEAACSALWMLPDL